MMNVLEGDLVGLLQVSNKGCRVGERVGQITGLEGAVDHDDGVIRRATGSGGIVGLGGVRIAGEGARSGTAGF